MSTIPEAMRTMDRWLRWRPLDRKGKIAKLPITTKGRAAKVNDPSTWATLADAMSATAGKGLGFVLGDGIGCIDLDDALDGMTPKAWAQDILNRAPETFIEVSQSGTGLHIWGLLDEAPGRNLRSAGMSAEVYSQGRYIALGGHAEWPSSDMLAELTPLARSLTA